MVLFYIHAGMMSVGTILMSVGATIVWFMKNRRWWLRWHRIMGVSGICAFICGLAGAVIMISVSGGPHFRMPHTYLGLMAVFSATATLSLGFMMFIIRKKAAKIRSIHRWLGRSSLALALISISTGLIISGII